MWGRDSQSAMMTYGYDHTGRGAGREIHRSVPGGARDLVSPVGTPMAMTDPGPPAAPTIAAFQEFSSFSAQISRGLGPSDSCCAQMFLTQALRIHR